MTYATLENTDSQLAQLMDQTSKNEEVIVVHDHVAIAKVVPVTAEEPTEKPKELRPGFGSGKDDILYMADDFDAPLEDFKDYM